MREDKQLIVGAFYWVIREVDPESTYRDDWEPCQEWQDEIQPARFNGWNAAGEKIRRLNGPPTRNRTSISGLEDPCSIR